MEKSLQFQIKEYLWPTRASVKVLSLEMKHGCDLVIIGLTGMQGFSHLKSQASEKTTEFHNYIYHSTPQNNKCIKNQQNSTK